MQSGVMPKYKAHDSSNTSCICWLTCAIQRRPSHVPTELRVQPLPHSAMSLEGDCRSVISVPIRPPIARVISTMRITGGSPFQSER